MYCTHCYRHTRYLPVAAKFWNARISTGNLMVTVELNRACVSCENPLVKVTRGFALPIAHNCSERSAVAPGEQIQYELLEFSAMPFQRPLVYAKDGVTRLRQSATISYLYGATLNGVIRCEQCEARLPVTGEVGVRREDFEVITYRRSHL